MIKFDTEQKIKDLYNQIKAIGGDITNPDDNIQLVKVVGDVEPLKVNKQMFILKFILTK